MKKRMVAVVVAVCALAVLAIGSTFAFFTSKDSAKNTFTMGKLEISVTEAQNESKGKTGVQEGNKDIKYTNALPGDVFSKEPSVNNDGQVDAWIRVAIDVTSEDLDDEHLAELAGSIIAQMENSGKWIDGGDGYVYYIEKPLAAGESVLAFETVTIPYEWGNEAAEASFEIAITAQGVQSDNNGSTWEEANWNTNAADLA